MIPGSTPGSCHPRPPRRHRAHSRYRPGRPGSGAGVDGVRGPHSGVTVGWQLGSDTLALGSPGRHRLASAFPAGPARGARIRGRGRKPGRTGRPAPRTGCGALGRAPGRCSSGPLTARFPLLQALTSIPASSIRVRYLCSSINNGSRQTAVDHFPATLRGVCPGMQRRDARASVLARYSKVTLR